MADICSRSSRNGHRIPATQITAIHTFAQEKAGGWGGAGKKKLGRELVKGRPGVTVPFQPPQGTSAEPRDDVVQVKRTWPVPQKKAKHKGELLLSWLMVSCLCCFWDSHPIGSFRQATDHFTLISASFVALCSSMLLGKSWSRLTLAAQPGTPLGPFNTVAIHRGTVPPALSWCLCLSLPSHTGTLCVPSTPTGLQWATVPTLAKLKECSRESKCSAPVRGCFCVICQCTS